MRCVDIGLPRGTPCAVSRVLEEEGAIDANIPPRGENLHAIDEFRRARGPLSSEALEGRWWENTIKNCSHEEEDLESAMRDQGPVPEVHSLTRASRGPRGARP